jgi:hypothetical protein
VFQSLSTIYKLYVPFSVVLVVFQSLSTIYKFYVPFSVVLVVFQSLSTIYKLYVPFSVVLVVFQSLSTIYKLYVPFSVVLVVFQSLSTLILIFSVEALEVLLVLLSAVVSFQLRHPLLVVNLEVGVTRLSAINNKYISFSHYTIIKSPYIPKRNQTVAL